MCQRLRAEGDLELHRNELDKSMLQQALEEDMEREVELLDIAQAKLATTQARRTKGAAVQEARAKRVLREMKNNVQMEAVRTSSYGRQGFIQRVGGLEFFPPPADSFKKFPTPQKKYKALGSAVRG